MATTSVSVLQCQVVDDDVSMTLTELCQACGTERELVLQLVDHGIVEPSGAEPANWVFAGSSLPRARTALRLLRDLELNLPGAALAVDLVDEISRLRRELRMLRGG